MEFAGDAAGLAADCHGGFVNDPLDQRQPAGEQRITRYGDVLEIDFRSLEAIDGRVIAANDAGQFGVDQE